MARRKKSGAAGASSSDHAGRSSRKRSSPTKFSTYVYKVLKQVHPELSMTNKAMKVMDDFMHDIYTRLVEEAAGLVKFSKKATLSATEFQTATRLILPGELAKHAVSDATKAVASFMKSKLSDSADTKVRRGRQSRIDGPGRAEAEKRPIEIEILRPVENEEVEPAVVSTAEAAKITDVSSNKRKATEEDTELETEPVASTSTPRKSPAKRPTPPERRSAIEALEALETPHKEDNKLPEDSEGEAEMEEERAPPTPPTEEESDESYQSLPEAEESSLEVEEREASNISEPGASELHNDAVDVGTTTPSEPTSQLREAEQIQVPQEQPNKSIEDVSMEIVDKPAGEQLSGSKIAPEPTEEAKGPDSQGITSSEEIASDKATQGTETDLGNMTTDTESSLEMENPLVSVHVQVHRGDHPDVTAITDISIFDRTAEKTRQETNQEAKEGNHEENQDAIHMDNQEAEQQTADSGQANPQATNQNIEADTSTNENDANLDNSLVESQPSILSDDSDVATYTRCYTANAEASESASKTVVTVKCSKVTTTKTVITHERRERVSEWVTEKED